MKTPESKTFSAIEPAINIPQRILQKMRLNRNYANVYTPFHDFLDLDFSQNEKKVRRIEK